MSTTHEPGGPAAAEQPLLLITGAAGRIGTYYRGHLATHRAPVAAPPPGPTGD